MGCVEIFEQFLIAYMFVFVNVHNREITNLFKLDANDRVFHIRQATGRVVYWKRNF